MEKRLKIDPKKVEYDGHSFRLIIEDEVALLKRLKEKQKEMIKEIQENELDESGSQDQAASGPNEVSP